MNRHLAWRVATREIKKARGRYLLASLVIGLVIAAATTGATVYRSSDPSPARMAQWSLGSVADAMVQWCSDKPAQQTPDNMMMICSEDSIIPGLSDHLATAFPGRPIAELRTEYIIMRSATSLVDWVQALEGNLTDPLLDGLYDTWQGALPSAPGEITLSRADAKTLGVSVGDTIEISLRTQTRNFIPVKVAGIHQNSVYSVGAALSQGTIPDSAFNDDFQARPMWFLGGGDVTWGEILAANQVGFVTASRSVMLDPPPADQVPAYQDQSWVPYDPTPLIMIYVAAYLLIGGTLIVLLIAPVFTIGARASRRDYALLRAQGAKAGDIRAIMLRSSGLVGAVASVIGAALGVAATAGLVVVSRALSRVSLLDLQVGWLDLVAIVIGGTLISLIAAWFPARSATREDPVQALRDQEPDAHKLKRARPIVVAIGATAAVVAFAYSLLRDEPMITLVAGVLAVLTLVLSLRPLLVGLSRLAPRLPLTGRVTFRDAIRRADRTVPAATAALAAVAAAVCIGIVVTSQIATEAATWAMAAKPGALIIRDGDYLASAGDDLLPPLASDKRPVQLEQLRGLIEQTAPVSQMADVNMLYLKGEARPEVVIDPSLTCPAWADNTRQNNRQNGLPRNQGYPAKADSPNCSTVKPDSSYPSPWTTEGASSIVVDDGTLVRALGLPGADEAAAALAAGKIVVTRDLDMWRDGTAHIGVMVDDQAAIDDWIARINNGENPPPPTPITKATVSADAVLVDMPSRVWEVFIPPSLLSSSALRDYDPAIRRVGVIAITDQLLGSRAFDELRSNLADVGVSDISQAEPYDYGNQKQIVAGIIAAAALFALIVTWGTSRLAIADMRPDLRVIYDVGATGKVRRRIAGLTTLVIGLLGSLTGVIAGVLLGLAINTVLAYNNAGRPQILSVPWVPIGLIAVVIPLVTAGLAWLASLANRRSL